MKDNLTSCKNTSQKFPCAYNNYKKIAPHALLSYNYYNSTMHEEQFFYSFNKALQFYIIIFFKYMTPAFKQTSFYN